MIHEHELDRLIPPDWEHLEKYPLRTLHAADFPRAIPVVLGVNWYVEFDRPERAKDGRYWVAADGRLTRIRGGHCVSTKAKEPDPTSWWIYYNQGAEGACVGFGSSRMKSLLDRTRYDAFELYHATQAYGGYVGQEGAYVRDAMAVLQQRGAIRVRNNRNQSQQQPDPNSKIAAYRWATTVEEILAVLDLPIAVSLNAVPFLNSWGHEDYPHITWMPAAVLQRLLNEDGEAAIVTDL